MRRIVLLAFVLSCGHAVDTQQVHAQSASASADADEAKYAALVERALDEYARSNWPEARLFFMRAHALRPSARTLRGLGLTSYEMRHYVEACDLLRLALDSRERPLTDAMRGQVQSALDEATSFVAHYHVEVQPQGATLVVDDREPVVRQGELLLDPGQHTVSARHPGFKPAARTLNVQGGERASLRLVLEASAEPIAATSDSGSELASDSRSTSSPPVRSAGSWNTQQKVALGLAIGAVAAAGVGTTFGILAANEKSASEQDCVPQGCEPAGYDHRQAALARARVSTIAFVSGGALLAAASIVYFTAAPEERAPRALNVLPVVGVATAGVSLFGQW